MLKESLLKCGVDLTHLREVEGPCGTALILLQDSGEAGRGAHPLRDPLPLGCLLAQRHHSDADDGLKRGGQRDAA